MLELESQNAPTPQTKNVIYFILDVKQNVYIIFYIKIVYKPN